MEKRLIKGKAIKVWPWSSPNELWEMEMKVYPVCALQRYITLFVLTRNKAATPCTARFGHIGNLNLTCCFRGNMMLINLTQNITETAVAPLKAVWMLQCWEISVVPEIFQWLQSVHSLMKLYLFNLCRDCYCSSICTLWYQASSLVYCWPYERIENTNCI